MCNTRKADLCRGKLLLLLLYDLTTVGRHVVAVADHRLRTPDDSVVSRGSVSDTTHIYYAVSRIYMHAREPKNEKHVRGR